MNITMKNSNPNTNIKTMKTSKTSNSQHSSAMKHTISIFRFAIVMLATLITMIFISLSAFADSGNVNTIEFTYAGEPNGVGGYSEPHFKGGAMLLTKTLTRRFDGCRIVEVDIVNGRFYSQNEAPIEIFFTHDLNQTPFHTFEGEMDIDRPLEYKSYPLEQPVDITRGEEMYVGFVVWDDGWHAPDYRCNEPVWTDGIYHTDKPGGFIGFSETAGAPEHMTWTDEGYSGGQVCIKLKIAGENMPVDIAELNSVAMTNYVEPSQTVMAGLGIYNRGVNDMESLDVSYAIGDEVTAVHIDTPYPIEYNKLFMTEIEVYVTEEGLNIPIQFSVDKVNGSEIDPLDKIAETCLVHSFAPEKGFPHNLVVEEAGGTGCGWCVRGIVGLDNTYNTHPDGSFIPISAHSAGYGGELSPVGYDAFWDRYITHNPSCLVNRNIDLYGIADPNKDNLERYYQEVTSTPAIAKLEVTDYRFTDNELEVSSELEFATDDNGTQYAIAYVVTEDNVGPYMQSNAYSGLNTDMDGWENLPGYVETYYDFLARGISDFDGTTDGIPSDVEPGVRYRHSGVVSLEKVRDLDQLHVIAMVINRTTGIIENGVRQKLSYEASVCAVASDSAEEEYFDLHGHRIACPSQPGIYLRRCAGFTAKILVR